jgi:hypothetical protein
MDRLEEIKTFLHQHDAVIGAEYRNAALNDLAYLLERLKAAEDLLEHIRCESIEIGTVEDIDAYFAVGGK